MLTLFIPGKEFWDEKKEEFCNTKGCTITLEHSLVSLSKWEAKWCKPFLSQEDKTSEEIVDYIRFMTLTQNVNPNVYGRLTAGHYDTINKYINAPMTATWFSKEQNSRKGKEIVTAEVIYYWMIAHNIPFECQKWHLNRLLTLIKVCNIKNQPPKKKSRGELLSRNATLNAARRKRLGTKG